VSDNDEANARNAAQTSTASNFNEDGFSSDSSVFYDGYDSDLIGNEEDRRRLDMMTEKEREEEIYRRTEQRDLLMKQFEMKKKLKQQQRAARKLHEKENVQLKSKSKSVTMHEEHHGESEEDLNKVVLARRKTNETKRKDTHVSKALANLKADREKKKQQAENLQKQAKKLRTKDVFSSSSDEEDGESKSSDDESNKSSYSQESESLSRRSSVDDEDSKSDSAESKRFISSKEDLNKVKMSRFKVEK
jgi:RNA polymerase-associated protein RTF1